MVYTAVTPDVRDNIKIITTTKVVLILEYEGTRYHGFQLQAKLPTVQGEIEKAICKLTGERIRVMAASRTDSGVHAEGQVVSFRTESALSPQTFVKGLNYYLPGDIAVKESFRVRDSFNVRRDAVSREYQYRILNSLIRSPLKEGFYYKVNGNLDIEAVNKACKVLIGTHDFASFTSNIGPEIKSTVRKVFHAGMEKDKEVVTFNIIANAFLPHQVRSMVGSLLRIGLGRMSGEEFYSILEANKVGLAGPVAPACGLYLMQVNYSHDIEEYINENI
jgi:tRNA pseudouridine38-40 synthase